MDTVALDTPAALDWAQFIWDVYHKFKLVEPKGTPGAFEAGAQAMTEAGVDEIVPWAAARSVVQWRGDRGDRLRERLNLQDLRADVHVQPPHVQPGARLDALDQLRGGRRGKAAVEIMLNSPLISDLIFKGEISEIKEIMKKSRNLGMQTFDQALYDMYESNVISYEDALRNADSVNDLRLQIKLNSQRAKSQDLSSGTEHLAIGGEEQLLHLASWRADDLAHVPERSCRLPSPPCSIGRCR